jgi:hypothetical protein
MSQHTPGPWKASNYHALGGYPVRTAEPDTTPIAIVPDLTNARLIAEAPAMLEALRAIATYMRGDLTTDDFKAFGLKRGDMTGNVRRIAENVLTRIDGEQ